MSTELYERLKVAVYNFNDKSSALNHTTITFSGKSSTASNFSLTIKPSTLEKARKTIIHNNCNRDINQMCKDLIKLNEEILKYIPLCSSPKAVKSAWDIKKKGLDNIKCEEIINNGGQLIPFNKDIELCPFNPNHGVRMKDEFIFALRHDPEKYNDHIDHLGNFFFQPQNKLTPSLRYRWVQEVSYQLNIPLVVIVVQWFKFKFHTKNEMKFKNLKDENHVFCFGLAKIVPDKTDILNYQKSLSNPMKLQLITRNEAIELINQINNLNQTDTITKIRTPLDDKIAYDWSYTKIKGSDKAKKLKKWAKLNHKYCPGCKKDFSFFEYNEIAVGHIIFQSWGISFSFLSDVIHHPDNLYLTCKKCNSSLSDNFPDKTLRDTISNTTYTIGDWLRSNIKDIECTKI